MNVNRCAGEVLGRAETYLLAVSLIQAFKFSAVDDARPDLGYRPGVNMYPKDFSVTIQPRY